METFDTVNVHVNVNKPSSMYPSIYKTKVLQPNIIDNQNILTQDMMSAKNTKYIIKWNYVLGENIIVPKGCIVEFDGGSFNVEEDYTLEGQDTILIYTLSEEDIFHGIQMKGTFQYPNNNRQDVLSFAEETFIKDPDKYYTTEYKTITIFEGDEPKFQFNVEVPVAHPQSQFKYYLSTSVPSKEPVYNTVSAPAATAVVALGTLVGVEELYDKPSQYIILPSKANKQNISDYIAVADKFGGNLTSGFSFSYNTTFVAIKWEGFSPLSNSDSEMMITFK